MIIILSVPILRETMPGRSIHSDKYRYGFNGHEKSFEVDHTGNNMTADFWQYDARLARRWNIDPETKPDESPYAVFANNPIRFQDPDGRDTVLALEIDIEIIHLSNLQIRAELSALKVSIAKAEMDQLYLELENLDEADRYADLVSNGKLNPLKPGIRLLEKFGDFRRVEIGKQLDKLKAEAGVEVDNYQKLEEEYSQAQKSLTTLLEKTTVVVIGVNSDGTYAILHKNNDKYKGAQSVYEIDVNGKKYKYGKADDSKKSATGLPKRLQTQLNSLEKAYGKGNVSGRVIKSWKSITTQRVKKFETKQIIKYMRTIGKGKYIPAGNEGHKKYGEPEKKPKRMKSR